MAQAVDRGVRLHSDVLRLKNEAIARAVIPLGKSVRLRTSATSLGTGQATKIVNNIVGVTTQMIAAEAYRICLNNGLKLGDAIPVYEAGTGRNFITRDVRDVIRAYTSWTSRRQDFDNLQAIMRKDIGLALSIGQMSGPLPMLHALQAVLGNAGEETYENWSRIAGADSTPS